MPESGGGRGRPCPVNDPKDPEEWEKEIGKAGIGEPTSFWIVACQPPRA